MFHHRRIHIEVACPHHAIHIGNLSLRGAKRRSIHGVAQGINGVAHRRRGCESNRGGNTILCPTNGIVGGLPVVGIHHIHIVGFSVVALNFNKVAILHHMGIGDKNAVFVKEEARALGELGPAVRIVAGYLYGGGRQLGDDLLPGECKRRDALNF